jgi:hypothetical protein
VATDTSTCARSANWPSSTPRIGASIKVIPKPTRAGKTPSSSVPSAPKLQRHTARTKRVTPFDA